MMPHKKIVMEARFQDRRDAGRQLSAQLMGYAKRQDAIVLALPRGGVPIADEVAETLDLPLDIMVVRKLGVPGFEELAMGAIAWGGTMVLNEEVIHCLGISKETLERTALVESRELLRREQMYREDRPLPELKDQVAILLDDGLATGSTMRAAVQSLQRQGAARTVVAVPIAAPEAFDALRAEVDEVVCLFIPDPFYAVGQGYLDFTQITDLEVQEILERAAQRHAPLVP